MEIIRINKDRLKIMMTETDRKEYFSGSEIDYENESTRLALKRLLKDAGENGGFDTQEGRTLVQVYESVDGGCEMFLTHLSSDVISNCDPQDTEVSAYAFDNTEDMLMFCRKTKENGSGGVISRIVNYKSKWYLIQSGDTPVWIGDFCRKLDASSGAYLSEHGTVIGISADVLAGMAK